MGWACRWATAAAGQAAAWTVGAVPRARPARGGLPEVPRRALGRAGAPAGGGRSAHLAHWPVEGRPGAPGCLSELRVRAARRDGGSPPCRQCARPRGEPPVPRAPRPARRAQERGRRAARPAAAGPLLPLQQQRRGEPVPGEPEACLRAGPAARVGSVAPSAAPAACRQRDGAARDDHQRAGMGRPRAQLGWRALPALPPQEQGGPARTQVRAAPPPPPRLALVHWQQQQGPRPLRPAWAGGRWPWVAPPAGGHAPAHRARPSAEHGLPELLRCPTSGS